MTRVELPALHPQQHGEDEFKWTRRLLTHAQQHGTNRQCSIGWHGECSDPAGDTCQCLCHDPAVRIYTVEGHGEGRDVVATRTERGQHRWPPKDGEPDTAWAHWVYASTSEEATNFAAAKQERIW